MLGAVGEVLERGPLKVFISYSHDDQRLLGYLAKHLALLESERVIDPFTDRHIQAGDEWAGQIDQNLESADIILLLVSASFLASRYCNDIELKRALERHRRGEARVIPVILRPSEWERSVFAKLQALPEGGKPITKWPDRDEALMSVAQGIRKVAEAIAADKAKWAKAQASGIVPNCQPSLPVGHSPVCQTSPVGGISSSGWELVNVHGTPYIARSGEERRCIAELRKPGMLIRIKSPEKMGKSMMMGRVLQQVTLEGYRIAVVDLREANQELFADINQFLQWFCAYAADALDINKSPTATWKGFLGANPNATKYMENELLRPFDSPLVLAIDNFDLIFDHPPIETDFCGLLRGWFEKVNTSSVWGHLRQLIVYSQESYGIMDINQSPLNVGMAVELDELNIQQVTELAKATNNSWEEVQSESLMAMIGGHPHLVQITLDQMQGRNLSLEKVLSKAATEEGIYGSFLVDRLQMLEAIPILREAMRMVVSNLEPVRLGARESFKLASTGLVRASGNDCVPRCLLYRLYFQDRLR